MRNLTGKWYFKKKFFTYKIYVELNVGDRIFPKYVWKKATQEDIIKLEILKIHKTN